MMLDENGIREILPQRPPMLMIDILMEWTENSASTEFTVRDGNIFLDKDGYMTAEGILENVAQTCAARIGYYNKYILHRPVSLGYIGEIRGFSIASAPAKGETLTTRIKVEQEFFGISLVSAVVSIGESVIAEGKMKIAVKE